MIQERIIVARVSTGSGSVAMTKRRQEASEQPVVAPSSGGRVSFTEADLRDRPREVMDRALSSEVVITGHDGEPRIYVRRRLNPID